MSLDENIFNLIQDMEQMFNILILSYEDEKDANYIYVKIWQRDGDKLLKSFYNSKINAYNMLLGIKFGIQATLNDDISFE